MNASKIRVDIWSDFPCPFCYIGKRHFERALKKFQHQDKVEVVFRSFQLDPNFKSDSATSAYTYLAERKGMSLDKVKQIGAMMTKKGQEAGLDFKYDTMVLANTYDAHRLSHFAKEKGKNYEFVEKVMKALFTDSEDIGNHDVLTKIAVQVGLNEQETRTVLSEGKYSEEVNKDKKQAAKLDIHGVPFFLFNNKYEISGAQPEEVFVQTLEKVWKETDQEVGKAKKIKEGSSGDNACEDGACKI